LTAELTADDAFETALRALRHRERSAEELDRRLAERGFPEKARSDALARLTRTGLLDDVRFARARAESLARRGSGDERIRQELRAAGVAREIAEDAIVALDPEWIRAERVVAKRGASPKTVRYLSANGFSAEVVAGTVASDGGEALG
jgi:regulatory protein